MAYICSNCRLAADRKYANCPSCGGNLRQDKRNAEEFTAFGYRILGKTQGSTRPGKTNDKQVRISDDDLLARLRSGYSETHKNASSTRPERKNGGAQTVPQEQHQDFFGGYGGNARQPRKDRTAPQPREQPEDQQNGRRNAGGTSSDSESFFAQQAADGGQAATLSRHEQSQVTPVEEVPLIQPEPLSTSRRSFNFNLSDFWHSLGSLMRMIPWRALFMLAIIGIAIGGIVTVWNMRDAILNSVLSFVVELMPLALIIGGIIYLIRSLFR